MVSFSAQDESKNYTVIVNKKVVNLADLAPHAPTPSNTTPKPVLLQRSNQVDPAAAPSKWRRPSYNRPTTTTAALNEEGDPLESIADLSAEEEDVESTSRTTEEFNHDEGETLPSNTLTDPIAIDVAMEQATKYEKTQRANFQNLSDWAQRDPTKVPQFVKALNGLKEARTLLQSLRDLKESGTTEITQTSPLLPQLQKAFSGRS